MQVSDTLVRAWMESLTGWYGPEDSQTPNSPAARSFMAAALDGHPNLPYWVTYISFMKNDGAAKRFLSFIEGVAVTMREAGVKGLDDDE